MLATWSKLLMIFFQASVLDTRLTEGLRQGAETFGWSCRRGRETHAERWRRAFQDRHESTKATIEFMRPRAVELARVLKKTGSFYYHCDWHASYYVKVMLGRVSVAESAKPRPWR